MPRRILLGTFEVQAELHRSASAVVYRARDIRLQRTVCVKNLLGADVSAAQASAGSDRHEPDRHGPDRQALWDEARRASALSSPFAVRVFFCDELPGGVFFAMEWADGGSLADRLRADGPLRASDVRRVLTQVGDALAEAHALGIVHRDVKPSNILSFRANTGPDVCKLGDFGIAAMMRRRGASADAPGPRLAGTPPYIAPELWQGAAATAQSDLYALAVTAYELWTGRRPFDGDLFALRSAHIGAPPTPPSRLARDVDPNLEAAILQGLAKRPEARGGTVLEWLATLQSTAPGRRAADAEPAIRSPRPAPAVESRTETAGALDVSGAEPASDSTRTAGSWALSSLRPRRWLALLVVEGTPAQRQIANQLATTRLGEPVTPPVGWVADRSAWVFGRAGSASEAPWMALRVARQLAADLSGADATGPPADGASSGGAQPAALSLHAAMGLDDETGPAVFPDADWARAKAAIAPVGVDTAHPPCSTAFLRWTDDHYRSSVSADVDATYGPQSSGAVGWSPRSILGSVCETVGRRDELRDLTDAVDEALSADPADVDARRGAIRLVGEAGVGKSRVLWELSRHIAVTHDAKPTVVEALAEQTDAPGSLARRIIARMFEVRATDTRVQALERISAALGHPTDQFLGLVARDLAQLLVPDGATDATEAEWRGGPATVGGERAFREAIEARASREPIAIIVDDAQWGDALSMGLLHQLVDDVAAPICIVLAGRPEPAGPWTEAPAALHVGLRPLGTSHTRQLVRAVAKRVEGITNEALALVASVSDGNPLFVEEVVQWLVDGGWIRPISLAPSPASPSPDSAAPRWQWTSRPLHGGPVTPTIETLVRERLDRLPEVERRVAFAAAVLRSGFPAAALRYLFGADGQGADVPEALERLVALGVLVRGPGQESASYRFAHRTHEEVAYSSAHPEDRRRWHVRAGAWLEGVVDGAPSSEQAALAGEHWWRAERFERSARMYLRAGQLARSSHQVAEAWRLFGLASRAADRAHAPIARRLAIRWQRARAAEFLHRTDDVRRELDSIAELASRLGEPDAAVWHARVGYLEAIVAARQGRYEDARAGALGGLEALASQPAGSEERPVELAALRGALGNWLGWAAMRLGQPAQARQAFERALADLEGSGGVGRERSTLLSALGLVLGQLGAPFEEIAATHDAAVALKQELAERDGDWKPLGAALINRASFLVECHRLDAAEPDFRRAAEIAQKLGDIEMHAVVEFNLCELALARGDSGTATRHLIACERLAQRNGLTWIGNEILRLRATWPPSAQFERQ